MSAFSDRLSLLGMRWHATHGVLAQEKVEPQPFEVDVVLHADLAPAAERDDLARTVDYSALHDLVGEIVTGRSFDLIEALAGAIARAVLAATDPLIVDAVEVRVRKPEAPIDGDLDTVEAALVRRRLEDRESQST
ncbi:MAG TPA: dihydroneopterin aldolase [Candidatus Limnocylindria bacterium]|nr:dihydroneopterin aldolase [Candidatus Limnocylindria bacterium]